MRYSENPFYLFISNTHSGPIGHSGVGRATVSDPALWPFKLFWHMRGRAWQLMRLYSLPSLIGLSLWHGTGADSAWPGA